jgi:acyl-CoA synthetase (AMP-forming)/AMP-acid ligase II
VTFDLVRHGDRPALLTDGATVSYRELAERVDALLRRLGPDRRLILLRGRTSIHLVVALCAAMHGRHPVMLAPPRPADCPDDLDSTYRPDIVIDTDTGLIDVRREQSAHELHPDLALLLTTSGSTGSPKLVRLSRSAVRANAAAITTYLDLTDRDRGLLTLPLHYCYGLSVLTSHLYAGAAVVVSDRSVLDSCLWELAERHRITGFPGVPYTFDQLDQAGFPELSSLRYVTQAGGKLSADRVRGYVELGRSTGWDFFVMYGQTEATARMAYLPPELADGHPHAIGVPVPGGSLRVDQPDANGVGELVYAGPNVMMGYATEPADLAAGHGLHELRTGDLGRENDAGLFEVVGRSSRFAKVFGLRLDLEHIERRVPCVAVEVDGSLGIVSPVPDAPAKAAALCNLPAWALRGVRADIPRTATGKPDYAAAADLVRAHDATPASPDDDLCRLYRSLLDRPVQPDDSFVSLGADSLSYVELSVRLGELLEPLPQDWHRRSIAELSRLRRRTNRSWVRVEPTVLLRSLAIVLIVGTHANLLTIPGGAHALLAVCGYNAARFLPAGRRAAARLATAASTIALPSMVWIGAMCAFGIYAPTSALLLNGALGDDHWTIEWQFWFLEAAVWTLLGLALAFCFRPIRHLESRFPFAAALGLVALAATVRYWFVGVEAGPTERYSIPIVLWCFALGWAAARATTVAQRLMVTAAAGVLVFGFFGDFQREAMVAAAVAVLLWARPVRLPRPIAHICAVLATASLSIYLTHWQVYPHLEDRVPLAATLLSVAVGVAYHRIYGFISRTIASPLVSTVRRGISRHLQTRPEIRHVSRVPFDVDRGVERRADEHRDRQHVEPQQHRDGRGQWAVDGRPTPGRAEDGTHRVTAHDPHQEREGGPGNAGAPRLPHRDGQVVEGGQEPDRQHEHGRPVSAA